MTIGAQGYLQIIYALRAETYATTMPKTKEERSKNYNLIKINVLEGMILHLKMNYRGR
jgi:hypothetical protein